MELEDEKIRCALYLKKKRRNCRMLAAKGSIYCAQHLSADTEVNGGSHSHKQRIPCPLDPKHTVLEHLLHKHLKKCNEAKKSLPVCYSANINSGLSDYRPSEEEQLPLSQFSPERVQELMIRVERAYEATKCVIADAILDHPALEEDICDSRNGPTALKHLKQQASILGHLQHLNLLQPGTCFIEFGAGKGKLSHCVQKTFKATDEVCYVLVDRANCRNKVENHHRWKKKEGAKFERVLIDIEHLDLGRLECLQEGEWERVVGISKHLCGAATDLTLRCLAKTLPKSHGSIIHPEESLVRDIPTLSEGESSVTAEPSPKKLCLSGQAPDLAAILIALCCHHRCSWTHYTGRELFTKLGFSPTDFHLISHMSSWAVCGVRPHLMDDIRTTKKDPPISLSTKDELIPDSHASAIVHDDTSHTESAQAAASVSSFGSGSVHTEGSGYVHTEEGGPSSYVHTEEGGPTGYVHTEEGGPAGYVHTEEGGPTGYVHTEEGGPTGYVPHAREGIGLKCKRLIDFGRMDYVQRECGLTAKLVYFVDRATSLENVLLVVVP